MSFGVIVLFAVFGQSILRYLNISLPALQCAGGLLLLLVSLELLTGRAEQPQASEDVNVALVPLGTPLLAGPGAIVATMVSVGAGGRRRADARRARRRLVLRPPGDLAVLRFSNVIVRVLGQGGITLVTRVSGLLLVGDRGADGRQLDHRVRRCRLTVPATGRPPSPSSPGCPAGSSPRLRPGCSRGSTARAATG